MSFDSNLINLGVASKLAEQFANYTTAAAPVIATAKDLTATGSTINNALQLTSFSASIVSTPAGSGVKLPDCPIGFPIFVSNADAVETLKVYPVDSSSEITGIAPGGAGTAVTLGAPGLGVFFRVSATEYVQYA
jgi:hypothetical protein